MMDIAVIRTSTSRPDLFERTHEIFTQKAKFSGEFRFYMHEDVMNRALSDKCLEIAKNYGYVIASNEPPIGQGDSIKEMLDKVPRDKFQYVFNFEDDWEFIRDIPFDDMVKVMDENDDINQICLHKRPIMGEKYGFIKEQVEKSGFSLCVSPHWNFLPALWRMAFIYPKWKLFVRSSVFSWDFNAYMKGIDKKEGIPYRDHIWIKANLGTYFWGQHGEPPFINHLGINWSARLGEDPK